MAIGCEDRIRWAPFSSPRESRLGLLQILKDHLRNPMCNYMSLPAVSNLTRRVQWVCGGNTEEVQECGKCLHCILQTVQGRPR